MGKILEIWGFFRLILLLRPAQALHPFPASAKFDGMKIACWAQTLHPISVSTKSDGMSMACLAQAIHPIPAST